MNEYRSIYHRALGEDFERLHPRMQDREGTMDEVWLGRFYTMPFLLLGSWRRIMFPASGRDVPFTISNYAYRDVFGRETVTWLRCFHLPARTRKFDATMIYSEKRHAVGPGEIPREVLPVREERRE